MERIKAKIKLIKDLLDDIEIEMQNLIEEDMTDEEYFDEIEDDKLQKWADEEYEKYLNSPAEGE